MGEHLAKNWIVYVFLGGFIYFIISVYVHSWKETKKNKPPETPAPKKENRKK